MIAIMLDVKDFLLGDDKRKVNMNVWLNPDGTRNREFRPYISQEETARSVYLYSPNGPGFNYGLYESAGQPSCGGWLNIYHQYPSKIPTGVVDQTGRLHPMRSNYQKFGLTPNKYESMLAHSRPT